MDLSMFKGINVFLCQNLILEKFYLFFSSHEKLMSSMTLFTWLEDSLQNIREAYLMILAAK